MSQETEKIKELLAVLELPEEEQERWALVNEHRRTYRESLADPAFRLRDEARKDPKTAYSYYCALNDIYLKLRQPCGLGGLPLWIYRYSQPIHWIIAALIAKELADADKNTMDR